MNERELLYFVTVVDMNSITMAAKALFVSQPAVSLGIKELEAEFDTTLFVRKNKNFVLTESGKHLYSIAKPLVNQFMSVEADMKSFVSNHCFLKVGVPPMLGTVIFPPFFKPFSEKYSNISITMSENGSPINQEALLKDDLDLAFMIVEHNRRNPSLDYLKIGETKFVFACEKSFRLAKNDKIFFSDLKEVPLLLLKEDSLQYQMILSQFKEHSLIPQIRLMTNQLSTVTEMLKYGDCGAFLFPELIDKSGSLVGIELEDEVLFDIVIAYKKGKNLDSAGKIFLDYFKTPKL